MAAKKRKLLTVAERNKLYKRIGMKPPKTVRQLRAEYRKIAKNLQTEVKRTFWQAMLDGKTMGEAIELSGIKSYIPSDGNQYSATSIACELFEQCHRKVTYHVPLKVEEIV